MYKSKPPPKPPMRELKARTPDEILHFRSKQVRIMSSTGTEIKAMAEILGTTVSDLRKHHRKELNNGRDYVYGALSLKIVSLAINGDVRSALAWMHQFGGWQETSRREITGKNGDPISFRNLDASALSSVIEALREKGSSGRGSGRDAPSIDIGSSEVIDLDPLPGTTDEGAE